MYIPMLKISQNFCPQHMGGNLCDIYYGFDTIVNKLNWETTNRRGIAHRFSYKSADMQADF